MRCDGHYVAGIRETEPTPPDANGHRWRTIESTGHITYACTHGLTITGPREQVTPLAQQHTGS